MIAAITIGDSLGQILALTEMFWVAAAILIALYAREKGFPFFPTLIGGLAPLPGPFLTLLLIGIASRLAPRGA